MCGDWCYTVRRATPCGLRDGLAAQGRSDRVARFEFSGSLSDEIAGKTRVSCLLPTPPQPSAGGRIGRRGKVGRKTIKKLSDKSQTASFVRRLFGIVAEQAILGGWATSSDSFVRGRAAGMRVPPPLAGYSRAASVSEPAAGLAWKTASRSSSAPSRSSIGPSMS